MAEKKGQKKKGEWYCNFCYKKINSEDKQVILSTLEKGDTIEEVYFHFECWKKYFNDRVSAKAKATVGKMQEKAQGLFNQLQKGGFVDKIKGINLLGELLNKDIKKEDQKEEKNKGIDLNALMENFGGRNNLADIQTMAGQIMDNAVVEEKKDKKDTEKDTKQKKQNGKRNKGKIKGNRRKTTKKSRSKKSN